MKNRKIIIIIFSSIAYLIICGLLTYNYFNTKDKNQYNESSTISSDINHQTEEISDVDKFCGVWKEDTCYGGDGKIEINKDGTFTWYKDINNSNDCIRAKYTIKTGAEWLDGSTVYGFKGEKYYTLTANDTKLVFIIADDDWSKSVIIDKQADSDYIFNKEK